MRLLVDFLSEASGYIHQRREKMHMLEEQFKHTYDRSAKQEVVLLKDEIRRKETEVKKELLQNLEEVKYIRTYFPGLFKVFCEDPDVGRPIGKKLWILDFVPMPADEASTRLEYLRALRAQLKAARMKLRGWGGYLNEGTLLREFPLLRGHIQPKMKKEDALEAIDKADKSLLREGWLLLLNPPLIDVPLTRFISKLATIKYEERKAIDDLRRAKAMGTKAEMVAIRKLRTFERQRERYETFVEQILLSNPEYLRSLKKRTDWLSREKKTALQKIAETVTPHTVKERAWLNEMNKRLGTEKGER